MSAVTRALRTSSPARLARPAALARRARAVPRGRRSLLVLLVVIAAATIKSPNFLFSADGWRDLLLTPSILLLLAVGQAVVIITRNVDLSVGSVLGLTAYLDRPSLHRPPRHPDRRRVRDRHRCSARVLGLRQRRCSSPSRKVPALVITLGTLYIYRGILVLPGPAATGSTPPTCPTASSTSAPSQILGIPVLTIIAVVVLGRWSATTCTPRAAVASSTRSAPTRTPPCSTACRVTPPRARRLRRSAVPSPAWPACSTPPATARSARGAGTASSSRPSARSCIGGVAIFGGSGTVWGAAIGAVLLVTINRALPILGIPDFWQQRRRRRADPRRDRARPRPRRCDEPRKLDRSEGHR